MKKVVLVGAILFLGLLIVDTYEDKPKAPMKKIASEQIDNITDTANSTNSSDEKNLKGLVLSTHIASFDDIGKNIDAQIHYLINIKKDIWETTDEFEQRMIEAIKKETSINGAGVAKFVSYDADTQTIELSLSWSDKIKPLFGSEDLPTQIKAALQREVGKELFVSKKTNSFDITTRYNAHKLEIAEMYLTIGEKKYILLDSKQIIGKWLILSRNICTTNGGEINNDNGICQASWEKAEAICSASGGRLPSIEELKEVVTECGGKIDDFDNNVANSSYQSCYETKGFTSGFYWSSSPYLSGTSDAWFVRFKFGYDGWDDKSRTHFVRCVRDSQ